MSDRAYRWVRVATDAGAYFGRLAEDEVIAIGEGSPFTEWRANGAHMELAEARLLAPVIPPTFYACGINYESHAYACAEEFERPLDSLWPKQPEIGYRAQSAIIGAEDTIVIPGDAPENVQCEGELAVVIKRKTRNISVRDALDCVFGYTVANDVSIRDWQFADRTFWRSKNADTFKPLGPWIATDVSLETLTTEISLNGELKARFRTNDMLYGVADYIAAISRYITLHPGDVIMMGTDGQSPGIRDGDTISIAIDGVGCLTNKVARQPADQAG